MISLYEDLSLSGDNLLFATFTLPNLVLMPLDNDGPSDNTLLAQ